MAGQTLNSSKSAPGDTNAGAGGAQDRYERLYDLIVRLVETHNFKEALGEILDTAMDLAHADAGYIRLVEPSDGTAPFVASRGFPESYIQYFQSLVQPVSPRNRSLVLRGKRVSIENVFTHPPFQPHLEQVIAAGHESNHMLPLMGRGPTAVGGICVAFIQRHTPTEDEFQTLELYARMAADTIEKHEQHERQVRIEMELRDAIAAKDNFLALVSNERRPPILYDLSKRELQVLTGIAAGEPDKQIAKSLGISVFTVNKHVSKILAKMDVGSRTEAGVRAAWQGLVDVAPDLSQDTDRSRMRRGEKTAIYAPSG